MGVHYELLGVLDENLGGHQPNKCGRRDQFSSSFLKLHLKTYVILTMSPPLKSTCQLSIILVHKLDKSLTFWVPIFTKSGWKLGVQIYPVKLNFNWNKSTLLKSTLTPARIWELKAPLKPHCTQTGLYLYFWSLFTNQAIWLKLQFLNSSFFQC